MADLPGLENIQCTGHRSPASQQPATATGPMGRRQPAMGQPQELDDGAGRGQRICRSGRRATKPGSGTGPGVFPGVIALPGDVGAAGGGLGQVAQNRKGHATLQPLHGPVAVDVSLAEPVSIGKALSNYDVGPRQRGQSHPDQGDRVTAKAQHGVLP